MSKDESRLGLLDRYSSNDRGERVRWRERLEHFTWAWFECTMSTGALATLLSQQPYTFRGLRTIGKVVFILDLVLFTLFSILITMRFSLNRGGLKRSLHHPHESFFFGTFWVSIALIIYCIAAYGVDSTGPWLVKTLEILYWLYAACALLVAVFQYHVIFDLEQLPVTEMMPAWILPVYPFLVLGPLASELIYSQPQQSALNMLIGGLAFQGLGYSFAFIQFTLYIFRLTSGMLPDEPKRAGMYVAVGPASYTSNALVVLGSQAPTVLPADFLGITSIPVGDVWKAIGVSGGIFLWLVGFWFSAFSTVALVHGRKEAHFTLNAWATIFPNAGMAIALIQIGMALNSDGIKAVGSALTIILCATWLYVAALTIRALIRGRVLWPHMDEDMEDIEGHEL